MNPNMNTIGRYMRIAGALVILLMVSFSIYYHFFHRLVTRDVDQILDDMGKEMINEAFVKPCRDPAAEECRQILQDDASTGEAPCDFLLRRARTGLAALNNGQPRPDSLRRAWHQTESLVNKRCPASPGVVDQVH